MIELKDNMLNFWTISKKITKEELEKQLSNKESIIALNDDVISELIYDSNSISDKDDYKEMINNDIEEIKKILNLFDQKPTEVILEIVKQIEINLVENKKWLDI